MRGSVAADNRLLQDFSPFLESLQLFLADALEAVLQRVADQIVHARGIEPES